MKGKTDALYDKSKLEARLRSKPYNNATLFEIFAGEVDKTKQRLEFDDRLALEEVYSVIYGDDQSARNLISNK